MTSHGNGTADGRKWRTMRWKVILDYLGPDSRDPFLVGAELPAEAGGRRMWRRPDLHCWPERQGPWSRNAVASHSWDGPQLADSKNSGPESPNCKEPYTQAKERASGYTSARSAGLIFELVTSRIIRRRWWWFVRAAIGDSWCSSRNCNYWVKIEYVSNKSLYQSSLKIFLMLWSQTGLKLRLNSIFVLEFSESPGLGIWNTGSLL